VACAVSQRWLAGHSSGLIVLLHAVMNSRSAGVSSWPALCGGAGHLLGFVGRSGDNSFRRVEELISNYVVALG